MSVSTQSPRPAAFSQYKPSVNAHSDFLQANGSDGKSSNIRVISLKPKSEQITGEGLFTHN
jgi:hypothetical protein